MRRISNETDGVISKERGEGLNDVRIKVEYWNNNQTVTRRYHVTDGRDVEEILELLKMYELFEFVVIKKEMYGEHMRYFKEVDNFPNLHEAHIHAMKLNEKNEEPNAVYEAVVRSLWCPWDLKVPLGYGIQ